ncbi:MAG: DUF3298 and DUF4163 domain-containing protein [Bacteroidetes bacterium]|nr:DUF3298 and DUF4163 domain-containing protein [Bacteroidota bacterium]
MKLPVLPLYLCLSLILHQTYSQDFVLTRYRHLEGTDNNKDTISLDLCTHKGSIWGYYFCSYPEKPVRISGTLDSTGQFRISSENRPGEEFNGTWSASQFTGTGKTENGNKKSSFRLYDDAGEKYVKMELICSDTCYHIHDSLPDNVATVSQSLLIPYTSTSSSGLKRIIMTEYFEPEIINEDTAISELLNLTAGQFITGYRQTFLESGMDVPESWTYEIRMSAVYNSVAVISLEISKYTYSGGAHGNMHIGYINYDNQNERRLTPKDIFSEAAEERLTGLITEQIRMQFDADTNASLADFGFNKEEIEPAENFYLSDKGIGFVYNSYEIAPYSMGVFNIFLPMEMITDLLKEDFMLSLKRE